MSSSAFHIRFVRTEPFNKTVHRCMKPTEKVQRIMGNYNLFGGKRISRIIW